MGESSQIAQDFSLQINASLWLNPRGEDREAKCLLEEVVGQGHTNCKRSQDGTLMSFTELARQFQLQEKGDFWKHLQIRHCIIKKFQSQTLANPIIAYLNNLCNHKASTFYKNSVCLTGSNCNYYRVIWQKDLNLEISENRWSQIITQCGKYVEDARGKFIQYKILHQYY